MNFDLQAFILIIVMSLSVIGLRAFPFLLFRGKDTPELISYLGKYLPYAIMGMMIIYCLKDAYVSGIYHGLPELVAIIATITIQAWKRNSLVAIVSGTAVYILLVNYIMI